MIQLTPENFDSVYNRYFEFHDDCVKEVSFIPWLPNRSDATVRLVIVLEEARHAGMHQKIEFELRNVSVFAYIEDARNETPSPYILSMVIFWENEKVCIDLFGERNLHKSIDVALEWPPQCFVGEELWYEVTEIEETTGNNPAAV